jgi:hypothetical protein
MAKYKLISDGKINEIKLEDGTVKKEFNITGIQDTETGMFIPLDPSNRHYQEYQKWLKEGNQPDPPYTLDEYKRIKKGEIKQAFLNAFNQGYKTTLGIKVDCKQQDILNFKGALELAKAQNKRKLVIRDYNNNYHEITTKQLETIINELLAYHAQLFQKKWELEKKIDSAKSFEELFEIKWDE